MRRRCRRHDVERQVLSCLWQIRVVIATADQTLYTKDCVVWVCDGLTFCRLADKTFVVGEGHDGGRCARAFGVFDNARLGCRP